MDAQRPGVLPYKFVSMKNKLKKLWINIQWFIGITIGMISAKINYGILPTIRLKLYAKSKLLESDYDFPLIDIVHRKKVEYQVYLDEDGQSYFIKWIENGEVKE